MSPALRVLTPGLSTTVQDLGRPGYQRLGVSVSGALDPVALRAANALVGNEPATGALEVAYVGPTLAIEADDARLAFAGASAPIEVLADAHAIGGRSIEVMRSVCLRRGEIVRIGSLAGGAVLYVAVEGGFAIEPVLGSVSTCLRGSLGGWQGRALAAGDRLPLVRDHAGEGGDHRLEGLDFGAPARLRTVAGPQIDYFAEGELAAFFDSEYLVGTGSDRTGMRLAGRRLAHARGFDITSDAVAAGSIQVPGDGQPIVLLADRQTTGGYPKIATVISADLPALGRLPIGARIKFEPVSMATAHALRQELMTELDAIHRRIVPVRGGGETALLDHNLISGVVDAAAWVM
jgi:biotin-dependent carboxylase-like uncharacterized protein